MKLEGIGRNDKRRQMANDGCNENFPCVYNYYLYLFMVPICNVTKFDAKSSPSLRVFLVSKPRW